MVNKNTYGSGLIEMGPATPLHTIEPDVKEAFFRLAASEDISSYLWYAAPGGRPEHRAIGAMWAERYGIQTTAENTLVCAGSQHALTVIITALFKAGDRIAVDQLTYPGLKSLTSSLGIRLTPIAMDDEGMIPKALAIACRRDETQGIYLMPCVQNPTTVCMSNSRRDEIAQVALSNRLTLIEDDAYALTRDICPSPLSMRMKESAVTICGVSKAFAAGLRIAFVVVPPRFISPITRSILNTIWMVPTLNAALICRWILDGTADATLSAKKKEASLRHNLAKEILCDYPFSSTPNGYFIWLPLPSGWTGPLFEFWARESRINLFCADKFAVGASDVPHAVRLSLTGTESIDQLQFALVTIRKLLQESSHPMPIF
jgi:DNA-binding transcriptional MocR family regulator